MILSVDGNETVISGTGGFGSEPVTLAEAKLENAHHYAKLTVSSGTVSLLFVEILVDFPEIP